MLSYRNLLYLEAELHELQKIQDDMDIEDSRGDPNTLQCFRSWKLLRTSQDPRQRQRMEMIKTIRTKIKEYREHMTFSRFPQDLFAIHQEVVCSDFDYT